ncbi:hypothetical protein FHW67_003505 [Herbaspirillum sp. Sphag1AN]|uniref:tyrosine-type recombinase/integrase n=1 Tax=unclassified Herbaspirillum TaxID=2624150 RepID=UPI0016115376|nr:MULTISPECIES: integrase arm-type DNA-binding domain-containing protein [unclassified Herbaspirillum]MBB3214193.1 hypothetical protein [Herbaspirillum sp. Sphag1AN]MBB3247255.1 hypothetical protein [Herbaspirillum sp. Sphag64]
MPKLATPLTDIQPRTAKAKDKPYKLTDGGGLYLLVNTDGAKYWRMDYRLADTRRTLAFGKYPEVSLAEARDKRMAARKLLTQKIDPSQDKKNRERARNEANSNTFEAIAREWHTNKLESWQPRTAANVMHRLEQDVFRLIGHLPITEIKAPIILDVLRRIEKRGALDMAKRQGQVPAQYAYSAS